VVAARVREARAATRERLAGTPWTLNAQVPGSWLRERLRGRWDVLRPVDNALDAGHLSLRGADRVLRIAYTIADLAGRDEPAEGDVGFALTMRLGRFA
jgi:magnesium chelatase family protein